MGNSKKKSMEVANAWNGYLAKFVEVYLLFIMVLFVLYCKEGYVQYDLYKRNLFYVGSSMFIVISLVLWLLSFAEEKENSWNKLFGKMDFWLVGILGSWFIGMLTCGDKATAFSGDVYRYMGVAYLGLGIVGMWIISRYAQWTIWLSRVMVIVGCGIYLWQTMNCYYIDPLNWTYNGQYHALMGPLANLNQNACYDAMFVGIAMAMFLLAKKKEDKIGFGIFLFLGYVGGIACTSSTFYLGLAALFVGMLIYVLQHFEFLWRFWVEMAMFVGAVILHKALFYLFDDERIVLESVTQLLFDTRMIVVLIIVLLVTAILIKIGAKFFESKGVLLSWLVLGAVVLVIVVFIVGVAYANTGHAVEGDGSILSYLIINDMTGNARGVAWRTSIGLLGHETIVQKLFGIGLNNFSQEVYKYYAQDLVLVFGEQNILADAHNVFLDLLISSGIVGVVSFFGISVHILAKAIRLAKQQPVMLIVIMGIVAWMAVGLLNANLIVTTQIYFGMLGVFWAILRKLENCEESKDIIGLV